MKEKIFNVLPITEADYRWRLGIDIPSDATIESVIEQWNSLEGNEFDKIGQCSRCNKYYLKHKLFYVGDIHIEVCEDCLDESEIEF